MARPELLERRSGVAGLLRLEPLPEPEVERADPGAHRGPLRERIARAAGGNPLFIGEMLAMAERAARSSSRRRCRRSSRPASTSSRRAERGVLERAAVEGEIFHRGAVQALVPDEPQVTPRLAGLVRKQLIRPEQAQFPGEDGFRFRHLLIRDAAYDALPKARRADLHERFARGSRAHGSAVELDELARLPPRAGVRLPAELGESAPDGLADAARERLTAAGRRSLARSDFGGAAGFLERAADLLPPEELDLGLETDLIDALSWDPKRGTRL